MLGCLMEKAVTTPDGYPLSLNSLVAACNQTTNRDPIVDYTDDLVDRTLEQLREKGLSRRVMATGQRVVKHRHVAEEGLGINAGEFAVLGVLLLRGAQTPGELKSRTERWHRFRSLEDVAGGARPARGTGPHAAAAAPARPEGSALGPAAHRSDAATGQRRRRRGPAGFGADRHRRASPTLSRIDASLASRARARAVRAPFARGHATRPPAL